MCPSSGGTNSVRPILVDKVSLSPDTSNNTETESSLVVFQIKDSTMDSVQNYDSYINTPS
jgi:hypothetical protein